MMGRQGISMDEAEARAAADLRRRMATATDGPNAQRPGEMNARSSVSVPGGTVYTDLTMSVGGQPPGGPVRVGGNVPAPRKIHDVPPVLPPLAQQAGVRGLVILELTVGTDGTVTNARVLRSIPLLDASALEAARQWRYEPVLLNGAPVPVIITATVTF